MAIIVNKEEKRRSIALSSRELLLEHGIKNITIAKIAECAGVGKGTIYEYFSNKEDIVFEIISVFIAEHEKELYAFKYFKLLLSKHQKSDSVENEERVINHNNIRGKDSFTGGVANA